jgi:uncharacterized protein YjlB
MIEDLKSLVETATGVGRPKPDDVRALVRERKAQAFHFDDDGETPNNPRLPFLHYRSPVRLAPVYDPAAIFEALFEANGWEDSWRDGMYDYNHWHTTTHEVLGIARGELKARFGGRNGRTLVLKAGDVIVHPAGVGHRRLARSRDLLVVGAYPKGSDYDEQRPSDGGHEEAKTRIAKVPRPPKDPVYGKGGPLTKLWRR